MEEVEEEDGKEKEEKKHLFSKHLPKSSSSLVDDLKIAFFPFYSF